MVKCKYNRDLLLFPFQFCFNYFTTHYYQHYK
eukprot:UN05798